jgi:hypothetical protein
VCRAGTAIQCRRPPHSSCQSGNSMRQASTRRPSDRHQTKVTTAAYSIHV